MMVACTTTERLSGSALLNINVLGPSSGALVLEDPDGTRVRLDPRSKIRLTMVDGSRTEWMKAGQLSVTNDGWLYNGDRGYLYVADVDSIEIENVDGVSTYFLTLGIVAASAIIIAVVVIAAQGSGGGSGSNTSEPRIRTGSSNGRVARPPFGPALPGNDEYYGPWIDPFQPGFSFQLVGPSNREIEPPSDAPTRLFTDGAVRRSRFAPLLQVEGGYGFDRRTTGGLSIGFGFAFSDMIEVSAGLRLSDLAGPQRFTLGYVRAGGNFRFDADDLVGAPIALDVAFGEDGFAQLRVVWGMRLRFSGRFELGLLPLNPVLASVDDQLYFDFPSMLQLGYRF